MTKEQSKVAAIPTREEREELQRLFEAYIDWKQVEFNGGPPCFFVEDGKFCLRAARWQGHGHFHEYVSLEQFTKQWLDAIDTLEQQNENLKGALISAKGIISCMEQRMAEAGLAEEGIRMKDEKEILQWSKQIIGMRRELRESAIRSEERIRELEQQNEKLADDYTTDKDAYIAAQEQIAALEQRLAAAEADTARLDWLEGEIEREKEYLDRKRDYQPALFRQNMLITRATIDAARKEEKP